MIGSVVAGRFRLERQAGAGGMGTVYRAHDLLEGGPVALKLLTSEEVRDAERFAQEAAILARLSHPAIVRYIAQGSSEGKHFLAMEWLEGVDLDALVDRQPLSLLESLTVVRRTAEALAHAHSQGVIHRDLKPQNLFLPEGDIGSLKLLDFGVARLTRINRRLTQTGVLVGTPGYLAPEVISGAREVDARADLFSLGCVAYRCLAGRPPFDGDDPSTLLAQIILHDPPALSQFCPSLPSDVGALVMRLLAKDPDGRPVDARAVLTALEAFGELADATAAYGARRTQLRLTQAEKRLVCWILVGPPDGRPPEWPSSGEHATVDVPADVQPQLGELGASFAINAQAFSDGTLVLALPATGKSSDLGIRAARAATRAQLLFAGRALVLCCGQGTAGDPLAALPALRAIEARLHGQARPDRVLVQEMAAALIGGRFELVSTDGNTFLGPEREVEEGRRHLLGKTSEFVGRGRELASLGGALSACVEEGTAQVALVTGAAGIGKSRLFREFLAQARRTAPDLKVLLGAGDSVAAGSPFGMVARALRRHADIRDGEAPEQSRRKLAALVATCVPAGEAPRVVAFLGELVHVTFPDEHHEALRAARSNPQLMGDHIRRAFEDWLKAESATQPLLFVLEDLHWGDAGTVGLFDGVLRNLREQSIMVLALARPEVRQIFPDIWAGRGLQLHELGPLARKAAEKLVRDSVGAEVAPTLIAQMVARADGNPFFLEEMIRAARTGRFESLPESVLGMVQARLDAEGDRAKQVLRAASVFGERFSRNGVAALLGGAAELPDLVEWLQRLVDRELLGRGGAPEGEEGELVFAHALVRDAAYATLTEDDRTLGHRLAGEHLENGGCSDTMALAEHFRLGAELGRSVRWYREAAEQALRATDLEGALARAERGLEAVRGLAPEQQGAIAPDAAGALRLTQAEALLWRGEFAIAERRGQEATEGLLPGAPLWYRAIGQTAISVAKQGKLANLLSWVERAEAAVPVAEAGNARANCLAWAASFLLAMARSREADALIERVAECLASVDAPDPQAVALLHQARAARASLLGEPADCLHELEAALAAFERAGDVRNGCMVRANVGFILIELGAWPRAVEQLRAVLSDAERLGLVELRAVAHHNLGRVLALSGDLTEGERLERLALDSFVQQGEPRLEGLARIYLAEIALLSGAVAEAEVQARAALAVLGTAPAAQVAARAFLAQAQRRQGAIGPALETAQQAAADLEAMVTIDEGEAEVRLAHAECLLAAGRRDEAAGVMESARQRLLTRAARIFDPALREQFLGNVHAHARTMALAGTLGLTGETARHPTQ